MVKKGLLGKIPVLVNWVNFEAICFVCAIRCECAIQYARTIDHTRQMFSNGLFVSDNFDGLYVSDLYRGGGVLGQVGAEGYILSYRILELKPQKPQESTLFMSLLCMKNI